MMVQNSHFVKYRYTGKYIYSFGYFFFILIISFLFSSCSDNSDFEVDGKQDNRYKALSEKSSLNFGRT